MSLPYKADVIGVTRGDAHAHVGEQGQHGADVLEVRDIAQLEGIGRQQAGGQDRQRSILGTGNADLTGERVAAVNQQGIHSARSPVFGGIGLHRQGVDLGVHAGAERVVDQAVLLHHVLAAKLGADDDGLEMLAVAIELDVIARQLLGDPAFDVFGGNHEINASICSRYAARQG
jgi:hypothetical protein